MKVKAVIFDLDGVIVSTDKYHYQAWKSVADELGVYFDETINNRLRGVSRLESLDIILERYDGNLTPEEKLQMAEKKNQIYRLLLQQMSPSDVAEDVRHTLQELRERGYSLAIGSSSKNAKFILSKVNLIHAFDVISDGENITRSKPDPEVFLCAAEGLNIAPENCMVIEDAFAGIEAAKAGGMLAVGIGDARQCPKADLMIETLKDLLNLCC